MNAVQIGSHSARIITWFGPHGGMTPLSCSQSKLSGRIRIRENTKDTINGEDELDIADPVG